MPHHVELSDATFTRLQRLATPLIDNIESVIARLADFYEQEGTPPTDSAAVFSPTQSGGQVFNPASPPDLKHTKVLQIKIGSVPLTKPTWNGLLDEMVRRCNGRISNVEDARRLILVNFVSGQKEDEGFHFLPEVGLSIQGRMPMRRGAALPTWAGSSAFRSRLISYGDTRTARPTPVLPAGWRFDHCAGVRASVGRVSGA